MRLGDTIKNASAYRKLCNLLLLNEIVHFYKSFLIRLFQLYLV